MDILIAVGIAVFMLILYCCIRVGALEDRVMEEHKKEMEKKIQKKNL